MKISLALLVSALASAAYAAPVEADVQENDVTAEQQYGGGGWYPGWRCYGWGWRRRCWRCPYGRCYDGGGGYGGGGYLLNKRDVADSTKEKADDAAAEELANEPVEMAEEPADNTVEGAYLPQFFRAFWFKVRRPRLTSPAML
ncbi:hypothetical protein JCM3774_003104 [Rhodotorula dairenensis]